MVPSIIINTSARLHHRHRTHPLPLQPRPRTRSPLLLSAFNLNFNHIPLCSRQPSTSHSITFFNTISHPTKPPHSHPLPSKIASSDRSHEPHRKALEKQFCAKTLEIGDIPLSKARHKRLHSLFNQHKTEFPSETARMVSQAIPYLCSPHFSLSFVCVYRARRWRDSFRTLHFSTLSDILTSYVGRRSQTPQRHRRAPLRPRPSRPRARR